MAYTIVGPIIKTDTVAVAAALDAITVVSADKILNWEAGQNIFFAYAP